MWSRLRDEAHGEPMRSSRVKFTVCTIALMNIDECYKRDGVVKTGARCEVRKSFGLKCCMAIVVYPFCSALDT